ncbi:MAG: 30S ribosomal protein S4 [Thermomicrobiales bacterium]|nr:30S ribosomal protein S4 [Thermomicrobiales bacterium]
MNYSGPKVKKSKALGVALTPKAQALMQKRKPSGRGTMEAARPRRRKKSDFGVQLLEKQRLRFQYNVGEKYLHRMFERARKMPGATGENLVQLLESRLDAVVLRAGFAPTIFAARQYVTHGHFELNGRKATIPSQRLKPGDIVTIRERSQKMLIFNEGRAGGSSVPYVESDGTSLQARFGYLPERHEIPVVCAESLVVEYYSR